MGFVTYEYGASGELYFAVDYDLKTAWTDQYDFGGNGDGTLFYPGTPARIGGKHDIPTDSIRLKRIRDGREDCEYLHILDRMGERAQAMKVARASSRRSTGQTSVPRPLRRPAATSRLSSPPARRLRGASALRPELACWRMPSAR